MGTLKFDIIGDNKNIIKALDGTKAGIRSTVKEAEQAGLDMDAVFRKIGSAAGAIGLGFSATQLVGDIVRVRGEIQSLQKSFDVLAGAKGGELFEQIKEFAVKTPMDMPELAKGAQTLMAFNTEAEEVMPILKTMGDIAMGNKEKFQSLILAFSQMRSSGRLMGQDLMQMINAGFNPLSVMSEQTGKSVGELKEEMSKGAISAEMVTKAFMDATAEGGKFHGMLESMSGGIEGMSSNLEGAFTDMLNEIGEQSQGLITGTISVATSLVENYKKVGQAIGVIVTAYGSYKAAMMIGMAFKKAEIAVLRQAVLEKNLSAGATIASSNADLIAAARTKMLTLTTTKLIATLKAKTMAMMNNPYVLAAIAVTALVAGIYKLVTAKSVEEKAIDKVNKEREKAIELRGREKSRIDELLGIINDETQTRTAQIKAYNELKGLLPELTKEKSLEELQMMSNVDIQKAYNEELEKSAYDKAVADAEAYRKKLKELEAEGKKVGNQVITSEAQAQQQAMRLKMIAQEKADYKERLKQVENFIKEQDRLAEEAKPIKVKIQVAEGEVALLQKDFDDISAKYEEAKRKFDENLITIFDFNAIQLQYLFIEKKLKDAQNLLGGLKKQQSTETNNTNYNVAFKNAKKEWEDADKALQDAINNRGKYTVAEYEELVKTEREKADAFKNLGGDTSKKTRNDRAKNEERAGEILLNIVRKNNRDRLELQEEGDAKLLEQIEMDYQDRIAEIEKQENELKSLQGGKLTEEQQSAFAESKDIATKKRDKETKDVKENRAKQDKAELEAMLENYLTYEQEREKIQKEYAEKRKRMQEAGVGQENIDILNQEEDEALASADEAFAQKSSTYRTWLNEITQMTLEQLELALTQAEEALAKLDQDGATEDQKGVARAQIATLRGKIQNVKEQGSLKPERRATEEWRDFAESLEESASAFDELADSFDGVVGEILSTVGSIASSTVSMINNIVQLVEISAKGTEETATTASRAIKAVETASVILAIISAAVQIIKKIAEVAKSLHNSTYENEIEKNQKRIDNLEKSYENLEEAVDNAFGQTAVKGLKDMNANLEQQNRLIKEQMEAESEIKQKDEDYEQAMEEYKQAMDDNRQQMEENNKAMEEAIFGDNIQSAIEDFADAYADAVADNMDLNDSAAEQAKNAMKNMVQESIKEYIAGSEKMEKIRAKMKALYADGMFDESDQKTITRLYEELNKDIDNKFAWAEDILSDSDSSSSSSSKRGIATASQESVDENNGRLMSIQMSMAGITDQLAGVVTNIASITSASVENNNILSDIRMLHVQTNGWLEDIAKYTKPLNDSINSIVEQLKRVSL